MYMLNTNVFNNLPLYAYMYLYQNEEPLLCTLYSVIVHGQEGEITPPGGIVVDPYI